MSRAPRGEASTDRAVPGVPERRAAWRRLVSFAALATFVALSWAGMLAAPPFGRVAVACLPVIAASAAIVALSRRGAPVAGALATAAGVILLALATAAGMVIVGLPAGDLAPGGWNELGDTIGTGFAAIGEGVSYPYDGPSADSRLLMLLGAPLLVGVAAMLTFLPPARAGSGPALAGLAVLVAGYATAETVYGPGLPVVRGAVLLVGIAAWFWLPLIRRRTLLGATALIAAALAGAVPATAGLEDREELIDYKAWSWAAGPGTSFGWEHSYGPIDWERTDETVLLVESKKPNYWKASVLDRFDGTRWGASGVRRAPLELPIQVEGAAGQAGFDGDWVTTARFEVDRLTSGVIVGPGTGRKVLSGVDSSTIADGSILRAADRLERGDSYEVRGYAPDPSAEQMRASGWRVPAALASQLEIGVPSRPGGPVTTVVPFAGEPALADQADQVLASSPYARVARLSDRLAGNAATAYDAVKAIEGFLLERYTYSERPPDRPLPLDAFLFEDRIGYCQQFSGAMALMLRMQGIPTRVATGFSPGVPEGTERYRVRALDAHSWVEVYFSGIGWVPFDPTPSAAPAELRTGGADAASSAASSLAALLSGAVPFGGIGGPDRGSGGPTLAPDDIAPGAAGGGEPGEVPLAALAVLSGIGLAGAALITGPGLWRRARERRLPAERAVEARVAELLAALGRMPVPVREDTTLLELEGALRSRTEPLAGRYVARLRRLRYARPPSDDAGTAVPPGEERRALRRRLGEHGGLRARIAAWRAIPPLSPRSR